MPCCAGLFGGYTISSMIGEPWVITLPILGFGAGLEFYIPHKSCTAIILGFAMVEGHIGIVRDVNKNERPEI